MKDKPANEVLIERLSWEEYKSAIEKTNTVIIPVGGMKERGTHAPLGAANIIAREISVKLAEKSGALAAPVMTYGYNPTGKNFPGAVSVNAPLLRKIMLSYAKSYTRHRADRIVFVNAQKENADILANVSVDLFEETKAISTIINWWTILPKVNPTWKGSDDAGYAETSLLLAIRPDLVDLSHITPARPLPLSENIKYENGWKCAGTSLYFAVDMARHKGIGSTGSSPEKASGEEGKAMLEAIADFGAGLIAEIRKIK
ncbi:MAG: creatininase family protein [Synergistaceae bacterium]|jgi:creatinine amidohydrolase|nr:creatininase family protein [Synergistaceae bacterium]